MNLLNIAKEASSHATPFGFGGQVHGIDVAEKILATDAGCSAAKAVAATVVPEFAYLANPVIDQLSIDAKENQKDCSDRELPPEALAMIKAAEKALAADFAKASRESDTVQRTSARSR